MRTVIEEWQKSKRSIAPKGSAEQGVNFPLCLAPMVGLSHVALRTLMRQYLPEGADTIWPTEMLNSRRIPSENLSRTPETMRSASESFLVPQILGNEEDAIRDSVRILEEWGASGIDINMGCPVQKALKHNYGVALMGDPQYAADVVKMTCRHTHLPVSVKLRAVGSQASHSELTDFVGGLVDSGARWICLHPRTAEQKRRGRADWAQIASLRDSVSVPIIGNGDVQTIEDVFEMMKSTQCDLVMAGRALAARPWMLWQLGEEMGLMPSETLRSEGRLCAPRTAEEEGAEYGIFLLKLIDACEQYFGSNDLALRKIRFYVRTTSVWLEFGQSLVGITTKPCANFEELKDRVRSFFAVPQRMVGRTELRQ